MKNAIIDTLKTHPYAAFLTGFTAAIAFGLIKLLALLQANGLGA
jgi:hypothetical protein